MRRLVGLSEGDGRPVLWVRQSLMAREAGRLYGHGLAALGLPHRRLVTVSLRKPAAVLWTIEEALKSKALAAVVADADPAKLDLATVRRLVLAAATGATPAVLCLPKPDAQAVAGAHTRWQVTPAASQAPPFDPEAPGHPAWTIALQHCRGGRPGNASAEWHHASHRFSVAAALSGGAPGARPPQDDAPPPPEAAPFALVSTGAKGLTLVAVNEAAAWSGLVPGLRLADARARVPDLSSELHEPAQDAASLLSLARWMERWTPSVSLDPPDGLTLDATGLAHLFGGEALYLASIREKLLALGITARFAMAGNATAARALARHALRPRLATIVPQGKERAALATLPVAALPLPPPRWRR